MLSHQATRPARGRIPTIEIAGVVVLLAVIVAAPDRLRLPASGSPTATPATGAAASFGSRVIVPIATPARSPGKPDRVGLGDGVVPDGTTVFDDVPAVANLDADLLDALRRAATDAADDGIRFEVESGWRSTAYQEQLFRDAVSRYGSVAEARRWVATPDTSAHVSADAVDLGPGAAIAWLARHGSGYGLCRVYRNEPWHFELRPKAMEAGCPPMHADAASDAR